MRKPLVQAVMPEDILKMDLDNELNILTNLSQESYTFKAEKAPIRPFKKRSFLFRRGLHFQFMA